MAKPNLKLESKEPITADTTTSFPWHRAGWPGRGPTETDERDPTRGPTYVMSDFVSGECTRVKRVKDMREKEEEKARVGEDRQVFRSLNSEEVSPRASTRCYGNPRRSPSMGCGRDVRDGGEWGSQVGPPEEGTPELTLELVRTHQSRR